MSDRVFKARVGGHTIMDLSGGREPLACAARGEAKRTVGAEVDGCLSVCGGKTPSRVVPFRLVRQHSPTNGWGGGLV